MAAAPIPLGTRPHSTTYSMGNSDIDAEGDEDLEVVAGTGVEEDQDEDDGGSDANVEADSDEEENDDEVEDDGPAVTLSRSRRHRVNTESDAEVDEEAPDAEESSDADENENESDKDSSDAESAAGEPWDGGSEGADEASVQLERRNNCVFCNQDEEHDPSEDFEEYMACAVCGDNSHRQCARDAKSLRTNDAVAEWRCPACVDNELEPSSPVEAPARRRSSATKFTRDLLPAPRGGSRPGSHSVFNHLILDDDPLDGSRSLRKRKASSETQEEPKKRPRHQSVLASELEAVGIIKTSGDEPPEDVPEEDEDSVSVSTRKSRPSRSSKKRKSEEVGRRSVSVVEKRKGSIIVSFPLDPGKLASLSKSKPKKKRPRPRESTVELQRERERPVPSFSHYATPFYAFHERENDELKSKPYGGVLSEAEADTSKTLPLQADRARFTDARTKAEEEWKLKVANFEADGETKARTQKLAGPPSKIKCVNFGGFEIETWYAAPYPEEYSRNKVLYICEFCLKYMNSDFVAWRHKLKCPVKHPPGDEIYRDGSISVFEVDGRKNPVYCQNLCLLAKLFLGSKTLYYDVEPFLFYVMTEYDEFGCHFVGYFSKEKRPSSQNNVSCILTLPTHQRKGYGNLLISFSYLLTRVESKTGSPEKPLSDMGLVSYRNYWRLVLSYELLNQKQPLSIVELSDRTGMTADDIVAALEGLRALVRDPVTKTYALRLDHDYFQQCIDHWESKQYVTINPKALVWTPYIMGRSNLAHYETAPPLPTIAPREDEEDEQQAPEEGVQQTIKANAIAVAKNGDLEANEGAIVDGEGSQSLTNGNISEHSKGSQSQDVNDTDPAFSQLLGSTTIPPVAFMTPAKVPPSSSPRPNGLPNTSAPQPTPSIPPIRYEVFPPIPGTNTRRRGGWRGGPRKSAANGTSTPSAQPSMRRSGTGLGIGKGKPNGSGKGQKGGKSATTRRTRLVGAVDEGADATKDAGSDEDEDAEKEGEGDETTLAHENEIPDDERDAEGDVVMEDEAVADADYGDGEDAEDSEAESEEEDAMEA